MYSYEETLVMRVDNALNRPSREEWMIEFGEHVSFNRLLHIFQKIAA